MMQALDYSNLRGIRTLGPSGTNLEAAAKWWRDSKAASGAEIILHETLESAVGEMTMDGTEVLLGCIVYPALNTLVFSNMNSLEIAECFVFPTHRMVLASRTGAFPRSVATHPAPELLVPEEVKERILVNSNSAAALACVRGTVDGCITTSVSAESHALKIVKDYGSIQMGFSVHSAKRSQHAL
jgi:hypothetical protein